MRSKEATPTKNDDSIQKSRGDIFVLLSVLVWIFAGGWLLLQALALLGLR